MNLMTKTNGRYTYEDFLLRKRVLKDEISDMENKLSLSHLPETLGLVNDNVGNKALNFASNSNLLKMLINFGIGFGTEKVISRFVNKKSLSGKLIMLVSSYVVPMVISRGRNILSTIRNRNEVKALRNFNEDDEI